jgi:hypothetical protein
MKPALALTLVILSALLLGAHFLRSAQYVWVAASLLTPALLLTRRAWAVRVVQAALLAAAGVWGMTAADTVAQRLEAGEPWIRLVVILGAVALVAVAGAGMLQVRGVRQRLAPGGDAGSAGGSDLEQKRR